MVSSRARLGLGALLAILGACAVWLLWQPSGSARNHAKIEDRPHTRAATAEETALSDAGPSAKNGERAVAEPSEPALPIADTAMDALRGRVVSSAGSAVPDAVVSLHRRELHGFDVRDPEQDPSGTLVAETTTGATGEFAFPLPDDCPVDVQARRDGLCPARAYGKQAGDYVELVLLEGHRVHGRVTRERDGAPVEGAIVRVVPAEAPHAGVPVETASDADGRYALRVPFGDALLGVTPRIEQSTLLLPVEFDQDGACELDVVVQDGLLVEGRVTDRTTGAPIEGARVHEGRDERRTVVTDARGEYRLHGFGNPDVAELHAVAAGYGRSNGVLASPVEGRLRVDFELSPGRRARGIVVTEESAPIEDAYVAAVAYSDSNEDWRTTRSASDGSFELVDLAPDCKYSLILAKSGHATQVYDFPETDSGSRSTELGTFVLRRPRSIRGRTVDDDGIGLAAATARLRGWNADRFALAGSGAPAGAHYVETRDVGCDAEGRFQFTDLAPGTYSLSAACPGRPPLPEIEVQITETEELPEIELRFETRASIRGRVIDEQDQPLSAIHVSLLVEELLDPSASIADHAPSTSTGESGEFELAGLPRGTYRLELFPTRYGERDMREPLLLTTVEHVLTDSAPLVVRMKRGRTIEGLVLDANGAPLAGRRVLARGSGGELGWTAFTETDGRFAMPVPRDTTWDLEVVGPDSEKPILTLPGVVAGTIDVLLRLPP